MNRSEKGRHAKEREDMRDWEAMEKQTVRLRLSAEVFEIMYRLRGEPWPAYRSKPAEISVEIAVEALARVDCEVERRRSLGMTATRSAVIEDLMRKEWKERAEEVEHGH